MEISKTLTETIQDNPMETNKMRFDKISKNEIQYLLEPTINQKEFPQKDLNMTHSEKKHLYFANPSIYDLRNVNGKNFITPVKNQGACANGIAFDVIAAAEGRFKKQRNNPNLDIDLSEAHLFFCHARTEGCTCRNGWYPDKALNAMRDKGVVDEACYPYTSGDQNCTGLCQDWRNRVKKITGWHRIYSTDEMKNWISTKGPLIANFTIYEDFLRYMGGIYQHKTGNFNGGTGTCCVGYNDIEQYWICKLSWGTNFGENGYFRIKYGECDIDLYMDAIEGIEETGWERNLTIAGIWAQNTNRNAYVYFNTLGWRKVCPDNDGIFFTILTQLISAKAVNRCVDLYQEKGILKQIYVF